MLTRIEIDGFKSFEGFALDLMPFTAIVGPNAAGKSNLFDALGLLSRLVTADDVEKAFSTGRGLISEQFRLLPDGRTAPRMRFAAEVLLPETVTDAFGQTKPLTARRLRYEVTLEWRQAPGMALERLYVVEELARAIEKRDDHWLKRLPVRFGQLGKLRAPKRRSPFLETKNGAQGRVIQANQDGVQGRPRPADYATATYLSIVNEAKAFPHLLALKQSLADVLLLHFEPMRLRNSADFQNRSERLEPDASNLGAVLSRIQQETRSEGRPRGALAAISADLSRLIPGVSRVEVEARKETRQFEVTVTMRDGQKFNSRVLSDGTLRHLALLTYHHDPRRTGTLCFEEPENGVHPARIAPFLELLAEQCEEGDGRLSQVIVSSHSPLVLQWMHDKSRIETGELVVADVETIRGGGEPERRRTRMRTGVAAQGDLLNGGRLSQFEVEDMLSGMLGEHA